MIWLKCWEKMNKKVAFIILLDICETIKEKHIKAKVALSAMSAVAISTIPIILFV